MPTNSLTGHLGRRLPRFVILPLWHHRDLARGATWVSNNRSSETVQMVTVVAVTLDEWKLVVHRLCTNRTIRGSIAVFPLDTTSGIKDDWPVEEAESSSLLLPFSGVHTHQFKRRDVAQPFLLGRFNQV